MKEKQKRGMNKVKHSKVQEEKEFKISTLISTMRKSNFTKMNTTLQM